jgi:hypothetical protein
MASRSFAIYSPVTQQTNGLLETSVDFHGLTGKVFETERRRRKPAPSEKPASLSGGGGFEPSIRRRRITAFETAAFDGSVTSSARLDRCSKVDHDPEEWDQKSQGTSCNERQGTDASRAELKPILRARLRTVPKQTT